MTQNFLLIRTTQHTWCPCFSFKLKSGQQNISCIKISSKGKWMLGTEISTCTSAEQIERTKKKRMKLQITVNSEIICTLPKKICLKDSNW